MCCVCLRRLRLRWCDVVYVESVARVRRLSLSGMILYHARIADLFLVQVRRVCVCGGVRCLLCPSRSKCSGTPSQCYARTCVCDVIKSV